MPAAGLARWRLSHCTTLLVLQLLLFFVLTVPHVSSAASKTRTKNQDQDPQQDTPEAMCPTTEGAVDVKKVMSVGRPQANVLAFKSCGEPAPPQHDKPTDAEEDEDNTEQLREAGDRIRRSQQDSDNKRPRRKTTTVRDDDDQKITGDSTGSTSTPSHDVTNGSTGSATVVSTTTTPQGDTNHSTTQTTPKRHHTTTGSHTPATSSTSTGTGHTPPPDTPSGRQMTTTRPATTTTTTPPTKHSCSLRVTWKATKTGDEKWHQVNATCIARTDDPDGCRPMTNGDGVECTFDAGAVKADAWRDWLRNQTAALFDSTAGAHADHADHDCLDEGALLAPRHRLKAETDDEEDSHGHGDGNWCAISLALNIALPGNVAAATVPTFQGDADQLNELRRLWFDESGREGDVQVASVVGSGALCGEKRQDSKSAQIADGQCRIRQFERDRSQRSERDFVYVCCCRSRRFCNTRQMLVEAFERDSRFPDSYSYARDVYRPEGQASNSDTGDGLVSHERYLLNRRPLH